MSVDAIVRMEAIQTEPETSGRVKVADLASTLDTSTTIQRLAARLDSARETTVVTNSIETFAVLGSHPE